MKKTVILSCALLSFSALADESIKNFNGQPVAVVIKKLGDPGFKSDKEKTSVYAWQEIKTTQDYDSRPNSPSLLKPVENQCVFQLVASNKGIILDAAMDGSVLGCASLKKKLGLI